MKISLPNILTFVSITMITLMSFSQVKNPVLKKTESVEKNKKQEASKDTLPLYNLYYLSKYINAVLDEPKKIKVYQALIASIGTEKAKAALTKYQNASQEDKDSDLVGAFLNDRDLKRQHLKLEVINDFKSGSTAKYIQDDIAKKINDDLNKLSIKEKDSQKKKDKLDSLVQYLKINNARNITVPQELKELFNKDSIAKNDIENELKNVNNK